MYVNAFWFGFLIAMVVILVLVILLAFIRARQEEEEIDATPEEFKQILEEMTGRKFRIVERNGYLVGEPIEEDEDKNGDV